MIQNFYFELENLPKEDSFFKIKRKKNFKKFLDRVKTK